MIRLPTCWPFLLVALAVFAASVVAEGSLAPYHFRTVEAGRLYRSGQLSPATLRDVVERYGIRTVVNLQSAADNQHPWHQAEVEATQAAGARHVDLALEWEQPPGPAELARWREITTDPTQLPVLVHCYHGVIRTGMLVSAYEMDRGKPRQEVCDELVTFGHRVTQDRHPLLWQFLLEYEATGAPR